MWMVQRYCSFTTPTHLLFYDGCVHPVYLLHPHSLRANLPVYYYITPLPPLLTRSMYAAPAYRLSSLSHITLPSSNFTVGDINTGTSTQVISTFSLSQLGRGWIQMARPLSFLPPVLSSVHHSSLLERVLFFYRAVLRHYRAIVSLLYD